MLVSMPRCPDCGNLFDILTRQMREAFRKDMERAFLGEKPFMTKPK